MKKLILLLLGISMHLLCISKTTSNQDSTSEGFYLSHYQTLPHKIDYGFVIKKTGKDSIIIGKKEIPTGSDYVHIFFDENGNLLTGIPSGIPWVNYVIHVIHPVVIGETYDVVQTAGTISGQILIRNASATNHALKADTNNKPQIEFDETVSVLSPSDNAAIGFQINKTVVTSGKATKATIGTYTITMSGYFNASIDVGILNSKLHNPTYTLVNSPTTAGTMVVKAADAGNRTMTTIMGTIYFSPIVFIEKEILKMDVPKFKLKGRSSIADHSLIERIYPTFGLSINENTFQNIFYGVNWEIIRGGSLFLGFHSGKINTYNGGPDFKVGETAVTADQFNLNTDTKWSTKFAIGATIDLKVVLGLLSTSVK